jgi:xanthine dehydrogenase small subunit
MAATPKRARAAEGALLGKPWTEAAVEAAMEKYAEDFAPLTDMRASSEYRALAAKNLLLRFYVETTGTSAPVQVTRERAA